MSNPIAVSSDLATFLGRPVDNGRAEQLLSIAQAFCEDVVTPLPASALGVVLASAARAYANPEQNAGEATGPYSTQRTPSVYLTRAERATLRRATGTAGAGSTSVLSAAVNAAQSVTVTATAGTYTLALDGSVTAPIAFNASTSAVQTALEALPNIAAGNVAVTGAFLVTFVNRLGNQPVSTLVADATNLTGSIVIDVVATGVAAPGSNLPSWEYDYTRPGFGVNR